ncbi:3-deoxy-7-phosphoheptulonate synthase [Burkholderia multivorans]|uniref:3-deoxy-7-phosphoheptulonate synthase n=2 Tax=Burkholderia multivorans TaxID=87883 RepID=UPI000D3BC4BC|nr:3-deoxy-7-phosphoheptulonate synthase [Burkholderia multivorans]MBR8017320.1 3-deoxy-7-phosphoheptulonate synthase [Burkholderia multivorans]MEB2512693.1 3-deoxy-7-phosphoheptulonate synthase [Burkholderia multivorans]MEB2522260.1 3-deoxy-7-phosphoheptulonate synthase [Burkholderia multivorans]MEB2576821.1 3-deoxy-7-phosphoheptulonate synthase [Burkholderia multivorans]MEB2593534.1 3-deoxy-7-phosphoheptulonate synthase [Burkholderia multivorans]
MPIDTRHTACAAERIPSPAEVLAELPCTLVAANTIALGRRAASDIVSGTSDRLLAIVGPCSIHDADAALAYARMLADARDAFGDALEIVMRVYFEKPRTTVGWKGLINDPYLDGSHRIDRGIRIARALLIDVNALGVPTATEFLDPYSSAYLADLVAWGAIGARTTESQIHREIASNLPMPIGFKNGTDGNVQIAIDAIRAAAHAHRFVSINLDGRVHVASSPGNALGHLVLRGGRAPNYDAASVADALDRLADANLHRRLVIDASHANASRRYLNQVGVCADIAAQVAGGSTGIAGVMIESNLVEGRQDVVQGGALVYGQSITDGCLSIGITVDVLAQLAHAVRARRAARTASGDSIPQAMTAFDTVA